MAEKTGGSPVVRVEGGRLRGRIDRGVAAFLGIPYAAPPFGARRMQPPEQPEGCRGVRPATDYGPTPGSLEVVVAHFDLPFNCGHSRSGGARLGTLFPSGPAG